MTRRLCVAGLAVALLTNAGWAQSLTGVRIEGPDQVDENTLTLYSVIAEFDNGWEFDVTLDSYLWVEPGDYADIGVFGDFMTYELPSPQVETIWAYYSFGADSELASLAVDIENIFNVLSADPAPDSEVSAAPDAITIELSEAADPNWVTPNAVRLVRSVDGEFGNGDDEEIVPVGVELTDPTHIAADLTGLALPDDEYDVAVSGSDAGHALQFDGGQHVFVPNSDSLSITSSLTVEAWVRFDAPGGGWQQIIYKGDTRSGLDPYYLRVWSGELEWAIDQEAEVGARVKVNIMSHNWSAYHHVAGVFDDDGDELRLYIDGDLVGSEPTDLHPMLDQTGTDIRFGKEAKSLQHYRGGLDEVRIWNLPRTRDEIREDMYAVLTGYESGLVGYWRFEEGDGQVAGDLSPFGNHGRLGSNDDPGGDSADPLWVASEVPIVGVMDIDGNLLDGEFAGMFPSGDATPGGDFVYQFSIRRVPGAFKVASIDPAPDSVLDLAPESIEVAFTEDVDEATVNYQNIRLVRSVDGVFGNGNDESITPAGLGLTDLRHVSMDLVGVDLPNDFYQVTLAGSELGHALSYSAAQQNVVGVSQNGALEPSELTVEAWILAGSDGARDACIVHKYADFVPGWSLRWQDGHVGFPDRIVAVVSYQSPGNDVFAADPIANDRLIGTWHHVAMSYSSNSDLLSLFIDGQQVDQVEGPGGISHSGDMGIGNTPSLPYMDVCAFDGLIDEVRIWNVARTEEDMRQGMHRPLRGDEPGLAGYWNFNEGAGQVLHDLTSHQNDGVLGLDSDPNGDIHDPQWVLSTAPVGGLLDLGGNPLDGEFSGAFPSGDGVPGGDFVCQFTLDQISLVACDPTNDGTLAKLEDNVIALVFDAPVTLPPSGEPLIIVEIADPNNDVSNLFDYDIDPDDPNGHTLLAQESGPQLANQTWYRIKPAWGTGIEPFTLDLCTLWGDANDSGRVTTADYSEVKAHMGEYTDGRYDLNGTGRVTTADYSVVKMHLGHRTPAKP